MKRIVCLIPIAVVLVSCAGTPEPAPTITVTEPAVTTTVTATATTTATVTEAASVEPAEPTTAPGALTYPSGDAVLDGYPVLVDTSSTDRRIQNWIDTPQVVALAPGVYSAYTEVETDLAAYLDGPNAGDCAVRKKFFPNTGGSCWNGVQAGSQEP